MANLLEKIKNQKNIKIASICGRFYSMDRDNRWDRINLAYKAIIEGSADHQKNPSKIDKTKLSKKLQTNFLNPKIFLITQALKKMMVFLLQIIVLIE